MVCEYIDACQQDVSLYYYRKICRRFNSDMKCNHREPYHKTPKWYQIDDSLHRKVKEQ